MIFPTPKEDKAEAKFGTSHSLFNLVEGVLSSQLILDPVVLVRTPVRHWFPKKPIDVSNLIIQALSPLKGVAPVPLVRTPVNHEFPQTPIDVDSLLSEMSFFVKTAANPTEKLPQLKCFK